MEKIKLNIQIVAMRKYVKQAKVHVINKLVKQVKLLQNRKGNEAKIQKAKRKAERYMEAVAIVKKIKPDEVTKLALLKAKDWKSVLQEKNSSLHVRCIAMLANFGAVQKEVEAFYNANKELVLNISSYLTQRGQKNKMPKNISKANSISLEKKNEKIHIVNSKDESDKEEKSKAIVKTKTESDTKKNSTRIKISSKSVNIHSKAQDSGSNADNKYKISSRQKLNNHNNNINDANKSQDLRSGENNTLKVDDLESSNEEFKSDEKNEESESDDEINEKSESDENNEESETDKNNEVSESDENNEVSESDENNEESESDENDKEEEMMNSISNNNKNENKHYNDEESRGNNKNKSELKSDLLHKKITNHSKNLKAITLLNLNELEGLDEIPVDRSVRNDESDENESSEDEMNETSKNNSSDPFFLSHNKGDSDAKELNSFSNDSNIQSRTKDTARSFNHKTKFVKNGDFRKRDNQFSSQKSEYNYRNNERKFKRETFKSRSFDNKFPEKNKNKGDFKFKHKPYPLPVPYGKKEFKNNSKSYESKDNTPSKNKRPHEKDNTSEPLHPSWQAKKKQKELLNTSFQGKRIVFND